MSPQIYVACLSSYNNGNLVGAWIDAAQAPGAIQAEITATIKGEEWAIHDYEDLPNISEHESIETVSALALAIEEHGNAFLDFWDNDTYHDVEGAEAAFADAYQGEYESLEDYAYEYVENCLDLPTMAKQYFNYEAFANDINCQGFWISDNGHVFRPV